MKNTYFDLVDQTFYWPGFGFDLKDDSLTFNGIPLMEVIEKFGTPLKLTYLPKITEQINKARNLFATAFKQHDYKGSYTYCYCTKSSHFSFVTEQVLKTNAHLETSSHYDLDIIKALHKRGKLDKQKYIVCNGFKVNGYVERICGLLDDGFENVIPVLDNLNELHQYKNFTKQPMKLGFRIAAEEEPSFEFYTSRLGIRYKDIVPFYKNNIQYDDQFQVKMLHFFINTGIKDTAYYWSELNKCVNVYCDLKQECSELDSLNIGGGLPVPNGLGFVYDYSYMIGEIVRTIKVICSERGVQEPNVFTEFGSFTVAESGAAVYKVLGQKQQNDAEKWYMVNSSFITTLPDTWGIGQRFVLLPVNQWRQQYQRVNLGGLTCDSQDYYNSEIHMNQVFMPRIPENEDLYVGFFHTGAYQESLGGYGGIQHCLIPAPQHIIVDKDDSGNFTYQVFAGQQTSESMMRVLGYYDDDPIN